LLTDVRIDYMFLCTEKKTGKKGQIISLHPASLVINSCISLSFLKADPWSDSEHSGCIYVHCIYIYNSMLYLIYRVSQEERTKLREGVPYVKLLVYRYNPKHLYPKLNGYGDNGKRSLKL